jgi:hypothetical protein
MSRMYLTQPLTPLHVLDGASFGTFTTFQNISPTPEIILPANTLEPGSELWLEADGEYTTTATVTFGFGFLYGATGPVTLAVGTALASGAAATSWPWHAEWKGRVRTVGATGTIQGSGWWILGTSLAVFSAPQAMPVTLALRTVTIDTTLAKELRVGAVCGTSAAGNTVKVNRFSAMLVS